MLKGATNRCLKDRWQHSGSTFTAVLSEVVNSILRVSYIICDIEEYRAKKDLNLTGGTIVYRRTRGRLSF